MRLVWTPNSNSEHYRKNCEMFPLQCTLHLTPLNLTEMQLKNIKILFEIIEINNWKGASSIYFKI